MSVEATIDRILQEESLLVEGLPGTGKTTLVAEAFRRVGAAPHEDAPFPVMVLTPDRRRAVHFEDLLPQDSLTSAGIRGGHRPIRSVNSYAYLVISQWLVEREEPHPRPVLTGGADEDVWVGHWLEQNAALYADLFPAGAAGSESLRMELRNGMARLGERGILPAQLGQLAAQVGIPEWDLLSRIYGDYAGGDKAFTVQTPRLDSARIQVIAAQLLRQWDQKAKAEGVLYPAPVPRLVLIDDLQDCTAATLHLCAALKDAGAQIVATSSPSTGTGDFRGAVSTLGSEVASQLDLAEIRLQEQYRYGPAIQNVTGSVTQWIDPSHPAEQALIPAEETVSPLVFTGQGRRGAWLSQQIRWHHYLDGVAWKDQAVIVRRAADVEPLRRQLQHAEVLLAPGERPLELSQVPVTRALLELLAPYQEAYPDPPIMRLLSSPLIGVDRLELFRFLRSYGSGDLSYEEQLLAWMDEPPTGAETDTSARKVRDLLRRAASIWQRRAQAAQMSPQLGLWELWESADVNDRWRQQALRGGFEGERADGRLDAIIALFRRADLWEQQQDSGQGGHASAAVFAKEMLEQVIAADSIAEVGLREPGVEILTVSQAAGRQWQIVYLSGLQDGSWPAKPRVSSLIHLPRLEQLLESLPVDTKSSIEEDSLVGADPNLVKTDLDDRSYRLDKRRSEARLLASAVSRAEQQLYLCAIENNDEVASPFLNYLSKEGVISAFRDEEGNALYTDVPPPLDVGSMVGQLRKSTVSPDLTSDQQKDAAALLAIMASSGVSSANPSQWVGAGGITTDSPLVENEPIKLSPSALQGAKECTLQWFFQAIHGRNRDGILRPAAFSAADVGTLVHGIAEKYPHGDPQQLRAELALRWEELGLDEDIWWIQKKKQELEEMVTVMGRHFQKVPGEVRVEAPIRTNLGPVVISGRADRIESLPDGSVRIVDIKTGKTRPSKNAVQTNLQLAAYQLGLGEQSEVSGAGLLTVADSPKDGSLLEQKALTADESAALREELVALGETMIGPTYYPDASSAACRSCPFQEICPVQEKGIRCVP